MIQGHYSMGSNPIATTINLTAGSSTVEQMSDTHLTEVRLFLGRPFVDYNAALSCCFISLRSCSSEA